jgi:hypothetical protein
MELGRGIIDTPKDEPATSQIKTEHRTFSIALRPNARLTVEQNHRRFGLGDIDDTKAYRTVTVFLSLDGSTTINFGGNQPIVLETGQGCAFIEQDPPREFRVSQVPLWLRNDSTRQASLLASKDLSFILGSRVAQGASVTEAIQLATQSQRVETRAAAARASLLVGDAKPTISLLSDTRASAHWSPTLALLRQLLATGRLDADSLLSKMAAAAPNEAAEDLRKLVLGPPSADYPDDAISFLISKLESRSTAIRVLAIESLEELTGTAGTFLAGQPNKTAVGEWKKLQASGRLKVPTSNDPLLERRTAR